MKTIRTACRYPTLCAALLLAACGGGSSTPVDAIEFVSPSQATPVELGTSLEIRWRPLVGGAGITGDLYADDDGDLATTDDQVTIATARAVTSGTVDTLQWDTTAVDAGGYWLVIVLHDGSNRYEERGPRLSLSDPEELIYQPASLTPDVAILTKDPFDTNFWQTVRTDAAGDVASGELDLREVEVAQTDVTITFRLTITSTVSQALLRADTVFFAVLDDVRIGDRRGIFWIQSDGASPDGFAVFVPEGGSYNELLFYPVDVAATVQGEVTLGLAVEHFAFDVDSGESSDFTVWASAQRRSGGRTVSNDVSSPRVVRFLKN